MSAGPNAPLRGPRAHGVTVPKVEKNAASTLEISDFGVALELGRTRIQDRAAALRADPRDGQLFLGGSIMALVA